MIYEKDSPFLSENNFPVTFIALGLHVVVKTREVDMKG